MIEIFEKERYYDDSPFTGQCYMYPTFMRKDGKEVFMFNRREPAAHEYDPEKGKYRATYSTFVRTDGLWWYAGECFLGETVNRRTRLGRLAERIAEVEKELKLEA